MVDEAQDDDDVFDVFDETEEEVEIESEEGEAQQGEAEEEEIEAATEVETGEEDEEPPASESKKAVKPAEAQQTVPLAAMTAQRRENQRLKAELEAIKNAPDPVLDPQGFTKHVTATNTNARIQERIEDSRELMLETHADFVEVEQVFLEMTTSVDGNGNRYVTNQALFDEMRKARNPAKFAYEKGLERSKAVENLILSRMKKAGKVKDSDFDELPDLTNVAATSKNTNYSSRGDPDSNRLDMFDD